MRQYIGQVVLRAPLGGENQATMIEEPFFRTYTDACIAAARDNAPAAKMSDIDALAIGGRLVQQERYIIRQIFIDVELSVKVTNHDR